MTEDRPQPKTNTQSPTPKIHHSFQKTSLILPVHPQTSPLLLPSSLLASLFLIIKIAIANIIQRLMKKNASCKAIRTNITSPSNTYKPIVKKPPHLDLLSCKNQQAPKIELPNSVKTTFESGLRKKVFSNAKLPLNNQNLSQVNLTSTPTNALGQTTRTYDQLKNKINNLEGRLVEIKKNFELSFQKRNEKSKNGKENQMFRDKQKSKMTLKCEERVKDKGEKAESSENLKGKEAREKEQSVRRKTIQLKGEQGDNILHEYVTTFACQSPSTLIQCTSQANLFKAPKVKETKVQKYYISALFNAYSNPKPTSFDQLCRNHLVASLDILNFIKSSNKPMPPCPIPKKLPLAQKPTLIFDLDETLIHCNEHANMPCDILLPIRFPNGVMVKAGVNIRPWARECLEELAKDYQLIVFTASHECYANVIIDYLDQKGCISHRYFRDSCWKSQEGFYVKDLRVIDRDLKNVLLIDNAAYSYCFQLDNGVPIVPFYDNKADLQLKSLVSYIKKLGPMPNIRNRNGSILKLAEYSMIKDPRELLIKLYEWDG